MVVLNILFLQEQREPPQSRLSLLASKTPRRYNGRGLPSAFAYRDACSLSIDDVALVRDSFFFFDVSLKPSWRHMKTAIGVKSLGCVVQYGAIIIWNVSVTVPSTLNPLSPPVRYIYHGTRGHMNEI